MRLLLTGLNHKTAPVEVRERLAIPAEALPAALARLKECEGVLEGMILSTCNRVELTALMEARDDAEEALAAVLAEDRGFDPEALRPYLYYHEGRAAVQHLFRVAASLDSMVVGEPQILGQMKSAYAAARACGVLSGYLDAVVTRAFSVAKRVRSETEIGQNAVSVSYAAVELAREIFGSLEGKKILVVGAGKMAELTVRHLMARKGTRLVVTNRTRERAEELAAAFSAAVVDYERFRAALPEMDIVITSSGAAGYVLTKDDLRRAVDARRHRPMFVIDIAVPRNVEPQANDLDGVFLYDIDDLGRVVAANEQSRAEQAREAESLIAEEVERLMDRLRARELAPTIASLQEQLEQVRLSEMERLRGRLGVLTSQQQEAVDALTRGIIGKIAHGPIVEMRRQAAHPEGGHVIDVIRRVFRLDR